MLKIIECPRDAMQGIKDFIPTETKISYLNALLRVGFDTLDFGSFVSSKAIPQMRDTPEVVENLDLSGTQTKLLAIAAGMGGIKKSLVFDQITYLGFPLSISETFQLRNTNKTIEEAFQVIEFAQNECTKKNKTLVVYLSMAFGNPYQEAYSEDLLNKFMTKLDALEIKVVQLSDTIGVSNPVQITALYKQLLAAFPHIEIGSHFHSTPKTAEEKIGAAYQTGCRRFDGAMLGFGGCPLAKDKLTGNIPTEYILAYLKKHQIKHTLNEALFGEAMLQAKEIFTQYH